MTLGIPGRTAPRPGTPQRTALTARISRSALADNLRAVISSRADAVIDVRADAWGHGVDLVANAALEAGAALLLVDDFELRGLDGLVDPARLTSTAEASSPEAVYGLSAGFRPVMSLHGQVLSVKRLRQGEGVSYGYTYRAARDTSVALVTGGYAQGVVRSLGNSATVRIAGERHPIIGRVAMDACVIDIGSDSTIARGDEVVFFGDPDASSPALGEWTAATGLSAAEIATAVGLRTAREVVA